MKFELTQTLFIKEPLRLCFELQHGQSGDMRRRRGAIIVSLTGLAAMIPVSLLQTGIIRHLPDPPLKDFDSDRVNSSDTAYIFGVPDGTVAAAGFAANLPLAAFGGANRARKQPLIPLIATAKAAADAALSGWYLYQMRVREKRWCGYWIAGALATFGVLAFTLPEARKALSTIRERQRERNLAGQSSQPGEAVSRQ